MKKLFCENRKEWVAATKEEFVRQRLFHHLTENLQFPKDTIALEKELSKMPHLSLTEEPIPNRRIDILCYANNIHQEHALYPLLIIECKAVKLTTAMMSQVVGYNYYAKAPFLALVNETEVRFQFYDTFTQKHAIVPFIPSYQELLSFIR